MRSGEEGQHEDKTGENIAEMDLLSVRQNGLLLGHLPEERKTSDICLAAVRQNGLALKFVPKGEFTEEICLAALQQNLGAVKSILDDQYTPTICLAMLQHDVNLFKNIPKSMCSLDICLVALKKDIMLMKYVPEDMKKEVIQSLTVQSIVTQNYLAVQYFPEDPGIKKEVKDVLSSAKYIVMCEPGNDAEVRDAQLVYAKKKKNVISILCDKKSKPKKILDELLTGISEIKDSNDDLHLTLIGHADREAEDIAGLGVEKIVGICEKHPAIKHIHLLGCHAAKANKPKKEKEMLDRFFEKSKEKDKLKYGLVSTLDAPINDKDFQNKCLKFCKQHQLDGVYVLSKKGTGDYQLFSMKYNKQEQILTEKVRDIHQVEGMIHILGKTIKFPKQNNMISTIRDKIPLSPKELAALRDVVYEVNRFDKDHPKRKIDKSTYPFLATIDAEIGDLESSFLKELAHEIIESDAISWNISIEGPTKILHVDVKNQCFIVTDTYLYLDKLYQNVLFFTPDKQGIDYDKSHVEHKKNVNKMKSVSEHKDEEDKSSKHKDEVEKSHTMAKMIKVTVTGKGK